MAGKLAARIGDMHVCPKVEPGSAPHVGGPIVAGSPNVLIGGKPAARVGDTAICVGSPDKIATGSPTVLINGKSAARMGDSTAHGGRIMFGYATVLIGDGDGSITSKVVSYESSAEIDDKSLESEPIGKFGDQLSTLRDGRT